MNIYLIKHGKLTTIEHRPSLGSITEDNVELHIKFTVQMDHTEHSAWYSQYNIDLYRGDVNHLKQYRYPVRRIHDLSPCPGDWMGYIWGVYTPVALIIILS